MSDVIYKAAEVDAIVNDLLGVVEDSLSACKRAQEEADGWKKKAQEKPEPEKVVLEKVAAFDPDVLESTLDKLESCSYFDDSDPQARVKMANFLHSDPNNALRLAQRVLQFSAPAPDEGRGVEKNATTYDTGHSALPEGWVEDGWEKVIRHGA